MHQKVRFIIQYHSDAQNELHPAVTSGDFGKVVELKKERALVDQEKYYLLKNHFIPGSLYRFPAVLYGSRHRSFQLSWLSQYNGLVYSESNQGGYCKYCTLFGQAPHTVARLSGILITQPLTNLQKASEKLREHFIGLGSNASPRAYHLAAYERAVNFIATMERRQLPIDQQMSSVMAQRIEQNRAKMKSIVRTVLLCGRQGLALRGHRDDWKQLQECPHANHGNFIALLQYAVEAGDVILADHLKSAGRNALYTSKTVQNELIEICGDVIRDAILKEIRSASLFSVMADEATDSANDEQLAVSIRYVHSSTNEIEERFLAFSECIDGVTGEALADQLLKLLQKWQLSGQQLCGQTYDGAGAMAGKSKGVAARISEKFPRAVYTHCAAHCLNLCVVKSCSVQEVQRVMDTADSISRFFANSPKRQLALEKWITQLCEGERRHKLKSLCKTRWVERHEAFEVFVDLLLPLVCCLEDIKDSREFNRESRSEAQSFFLAVCHFPFLVTLLVAKELLGYTKALSVKLQGRYVDVVRAYNEVSFVKSALQSTRESVDSFHSLFYSKALEIAELVNVQESMPRTTGRQHNRSNVPASCPSEYYQRVVTIPVLDHLISEIDSRFNSRTSSLVTEVMQLLPPQIAKRDSTITPNELTEFRAVYGDILPSPLSLDTELHCWWVKWQENASTAEELQTPLKVLPLIDTDFFPNIYQIIKIACTQSVTSVECERSISSLRFIKTYLRTTMGEARLNGLALMYIHRDIECDIDSVVDEFGRRNPQRMKLCNPFISDKEQD